MNNVEISVKNTTGGPLAMIRKYHDGESIPRLWSQGDTLKGHAFTINVAMGQAHLHDSLGQHAVAVNFAQAIELTPHIYRKP